MMPQNSFVPTLSAFPPQMLGSLLNVIEKLLSKGYDEAAARIALLACPPCSSPPPPSPPPHWCPLSSPPPSPPTRPKRRRRRRRSKSPSPSTTFSAHLSSDIDALLHSISNLPVTPLIKEESESLEEGVEREVLTMPPPSLGCVVEEVTVKQEGSIVAGQKDNCADVAARSQFGDYPSVDSVHARIAKDMVNVLAIAAATEEITFKATPVRLFWPRPAV